MQVQQNLQFVFFFLNFHASHENPAALKLRHKPLCSVSAERKETFPSDGRHADEWLLAAVTVGFLFVWWPWQTGENIQRAREEETKDGLFKRSVPAVAALNSAAWHPLTDVLCSNWRSCSGRCCIPIRKINAKQSSSLPCPPPLSSKALSVFLNEGQTPHQTQKKNCLLFLLSKAHHSLFLPSSFCRIFVGLTAVTSV